MVLPKNTSYVSVITSSDNTSILKREKLIYFFDRSISPLTKLTLQYFTCTFSPFHTRSFSLVAPVSAPWCTLQYPRLFAFLPTSSNWKAMGARPLYEGALASFARPGTLHFGTVVPIALIIAIRRFCCRKNVGTLSICRTMLRGPVESDRLPPRGPREIARGHRPFRCVHSSGERCATCGTHPRKRINRTRGTPMSVLRAHRSTSRM